MENKNETLNSTVAATIIDMAKKRKNGQTTSGSSQDVAKSMTAAAELKGIAADTIEFAPVPLMGAKTHEQVTALYSRDDKNVIRSVTDAELEDLIMNEAPVMLSRQRGEVFKFAKGLIAQNRPLNLAEVQAVAFADDEGLAFTRVPFNRNSPAPAIENLPGFANFLSRCGGPEAIHALKMYLGSLLDTKSTRRQYLVIYGSGTDGKSTLMDGIIKALGEHNVEKCSATEVNSTHFGETLEGKRLLYFAEENNSSFFSTGKFKALTGEKSMKINPKHKTARTVKLTCKVIVVTNSSPEITSNLADVSRIVAIKVAPDTEQGYWKSWAQNLEETGTEILQHCFAYYQAAVDVDPKLRMYLPANSVGTEAALDSKYADIDDEILELFEFTADEKDNISRAEVHRLVADKMGERKSNKAFLRLIKEALVRKGATEGKVHGGREVYRKIKFGVPHGISKI